MHANTFTVDFIHVLPLVSLYVIGFNYYIHCIYPIIPLIVFEYFMSWFNAAVKVCVATFPDMWTSGLRVNMVLSTPSQLCRCHCAAVNFLLFPNRAALIICVLNDLS